MKKYNIGLDIGTNSVGWAVTDELGHLKKYRGKNMWGVRLFETAKTAEGRRTHRSMRRRLARRKQRIEKLQEIFYEDMIKIDEKFFIRLKESFLYNEDNSTLSSSILFDDSNYLDKDYYSEYPTIYHLRKDIINSKDKKDIRLIYLALHHMLKYRGNFLYGKVDFSEFSNSVEQSLENTFKNIFTDEECNVDSIDLGKVKNILSSNDKKANKKELLENLLKDKDKDVNDKIKEIIKAILGYKFNISKLFEIEGIDKKKTESFKNEVDETEIESILGEKTEIFNSLKEVYNWVVLEEILGDIDSENPEDKTISSAMIVKYEKHKKELKMLKKLVKDVCPKEYNEIFRTEGEKPNYANYIKNTKKYSLEDFNKYISKILNKYPKFIEHEYYEYINEQLKEINLLSKLNTTDNSVIPYQLQKIEMNKIIESQGIYYPFLKDNKELLLKILESRLPYYVGPLNKHSGFAWLERTSHETKIYPWNFEESVDIDKTAENFIKRMTNKCTYMRDKYVLPRNSLDYSEFVLLNELNKIRVNGELISRESKESIIEDIFKKKKTVKSKDLIDWVKNNPSGFIKNISDDILIEGTQQENEFAASLDSYCDFKKLFGVVDNSNKEMIEEIINWITIFEDKDILKRKIKEEYKLSKDIIEKISKLNYTGWARLSKDLINGIPNQRDFKFLGQTILEIMRNTNYNFMQIINDTKFDFKETIDRLNPKIEKDKLDYEDIKLLQGSPALKRGIWETVKVIDEIVKVMKNEPQNIFIEFARDDQASKRTTSRVNRMKNLYEEIKKDASMYNKEVYDDLKNCEMSKNKLGNEALFLYFTQNGRCMYTGESLSLNKLHDYQIDHIIPQSYIKDDSIDNTVLVTTKANQDKKDNLVLDYKVQSSQSEYWQKLYKHGLISKKKLENLKRDGILDKQIIGFINRQLVETRQISKHISDLLSEVYKNTKIFSIKGRLTSDYRKQYELYKSREINDYHHAQDALIVSVMGNFVIKRYPNLEDEFNIKNYITWFKDSNMHRNGKNKYGFILSSMNKDYSNNGFEWKRDEEISRMKKAFNYKDCFITKKVEEQTGEFYDQTIYKHDDPKAKIPLKKKLDPKKYGGYSSMNSAYYAAIEHVKGKKIVREIVNIPIVDTKEVEKIGLENYIKEKKGITDKSDLKILKNKIKKYQLIEYEGQEVYLISDAELRNATQLIIDDKYKKLINQISKDKIEEVDEKEADEFLDHFVEKLFKHYPLYEKLAEEIKDSKEKFLELQLDEKIKFIKEMIKMTQAKAVVGKFKSFKTKIKTDEAGRLKKRLNIEEAVFIDKSITGLIERRYKL